jgi:hypothetical protein
LQRITRELFDYWSALRGARPAPDREDVDPGAIRGCLANTFVLAFDPARGHPFRIAGTAICTIFGSELTGTPFAALWMTGASRALHDLVRSVAEHCETAVAGATGCNAENDALELEMILLPLNGGGGDGTRLLGAFVPAETPYWLGERPLQKLHLGFSRPAVAGVRTKDFRAAGLPDIPRNGHG